MSFAASFLCLIWSFLTANTVVNAIAEPRVTTHNGSLVMIVDVERDVNIILRSNGIETQSFSLLELFQTVDTLKKQLESLSLNLVGPPGPKGNRGLQGQRGEKGVPGLQGERGLLGSTGSAGPAGAPGAPGATGPRGLTGPVGSTGDPGPRGDTGSTGTRGATGARGPSGVTRITTSCVDRASSCQSAGGRNLEYLDRQSVGCPSGYTLASFDFTPSGCRGGDRRFEFTCCKFYPY